MKIEDYIIVGCVAVIFVLICGTIHKHWNSNCYDVTGLDKESE